MWQDSEKCDVACYDVNRVFFVFLLAVAQPAQASDPHLFHPEELSIPLLIRTPAYSGPKSIVVFY